MMLNDILLHSPRYLVEIKPLLGTMFQKYLTPYSHWSYTDPDIIWANLADWVEVKDLERFHIVTFAKNMDAGRLFLRGQVCNILIYTTLCDWILTIICIIFSLFFLF